MLHRLIIALTLLSALPVFAAPGFGLAHCFTPHMVVQADKPVPIWGVGAPGANVTVTLGEQSKTATIGADGKWTVTFDPMKAGGPLTLKAQADRTLTVDDVMVGEVWLCSGQSNMALPVTKTLNFETEVAAANYPDIRMLGPNNKWVVCSPQTVGAFSAAAYYFGRELDQKLKEPIGLINASAGGTPIELWTSAETQKAVPELKPLFDTTPAAAFASDADAEQAKSDAGQAQEVEGKKAVVVAKVQPGDQYKKHILTLAPYAIRGVIWYQGEANSYTIHANLYGIQLMTMIKEWRGKWGYDFPFIIVQLPEIGRPQSAPDETNGRTLVRDGQLKAMSLPDVGMAVTLGTGEEKNNHPKNKQECGRRLALWALANVYGQKDVAASGPLPASNKVDGNKIVVTFSHTDGGLVAQGGGELKGFGIAGADMKFSWAKAEISGDTVTLSSPDVASPVAVRYAWSSNPATANLYNGAGLPASPFRTDDAPVSNAAMR
jgi:sialate O-acetylesterase